MNFGSKTEHIFARKNIVGGFSALYVGSKMPMFNLLTFNLVFFRKKTGCSNIKNLFECF